ETLNDMLERLEEAFARERAFVSDASHELRTPLSILRAELELALRDARDVEGFRSAVTSAAEEADRLAQLAEDLLVIARFDQGQLPVRIQAVRVDEMLDAVSRRFSGRAAARDVELVVTAPAGEVAGVDRLRVEQALGNLVDNALRHGSRRIELAAGVDGDRLELHVRDDGSGFPESFLDSAFERFSRADHARGPGGAGLGLAIVAAIASAHHGRAAAVNRPEGGADVWMDLPRRPAGSPD
ncbi:MAG: HAMP domain-containing histidine kinase, partial [Actinomycetota bacterium]|nr:HAMP domain-containing histidine kinase [Actinomycetota bacterium]